MTTLAIYRPPSTLIVTIDIDERTTFSKRLMGEWLISCQVNVNTTLAIQIGDYITYDSENYYVNRLPDIVKLNNGTFQYTIVFQSVLYNLQRKRFRSSDNLITFSYNGTPTDFVTNIVANINEIDPGWTVGTIDTADEQTMEFNKETCLAALTRVAEAFKMEYQVVGREISLKKSVGLTRALTFEYGRGLGLYKITRQQVNDQNIITKCYGYGGTKNIDIDYRGRAKQLIFDSGGDSFLMKNDDLYGIIEGDFTDENIYPKRTGVLSSVNMVFDAGTSGEDFNPNTSYVVDSAIDFDINDYLIEGQTATIVFKTGDLAGVECEIWKYVAATKRIYFNAYTDPDGYVQPNYNSGSPIAPAASDTYTLINISMPQSYIDDAEDELEAATQTFLDENCIPMVVYSVEMDPKHAKDNVITLDAGDRVTVTDADLAIDALIRVSGIEYPLVNPYKIKATIADFVPYTLQERIVKAAISTIKETKFVEKRSAELARRNTVRQNQLKKLLFNADGLFSPEGVNPLWVDTLLLTVGSQFSDFRLSGVKIEPNHNADANEIVISAGHLIHLQFSISGVYDWNIASAATFSSLTPTSAYYLYAKCSKTALTGTWYLSTSQKAADGNDGYYFFVGILYTVLDGARDFDFGYGMTYINGRVITTGRIRSIDGLNYFDLDENQFMLGDANSSLDWNVTAAGVLTLKGALVQSPGGSTAPILVNRGPYNAGITYYIGESVTSGGSTWNWINATPASGHTPDEDAYWTLASSGGIGPQGDIGETGDTGAVGPGLAYQGVFSASKVYYNNSLRRDIVSYPTITDPAYLFKGTDGTSGAWSSGNWDSFGATFSSIATGILFATLAYIENLGVRKLQTAATGKRIEINTDDAGNIDIYSAGGDLVAQMGAVSYLGLPGIKIPGGHLTIVSPYSLAIVDSSDNMLSSFDALKIKMPKSTTVNRPNLVAEDGTFYFDTDKSELCLYTQGAWWHVTLHPDH